MKATHENGVQRQQSPLEEEITSSVCRRILIVGAGGFGREVLNWARDAWPDQASKIAGFLSADPSRLSGHPTTLPILGDPASFTPKQGDGLILAIGIPEVRRVIAADLESRGGKFLTLVHPTAVVAASASIGSGSVLCPFTIVSDSAVTCRGVLLNYFSSLGHDACAGAFSVLSPYATLGGGARLADDVFLGLHGAVAPGKRIGQGSHISANSAAMTDVPPLSLVFGVPGRIKPRIALQ